MALDYAGIYDRVYSTRPHYSAIDNSPAARHLALASKLWPRIYEMGSVIDVGGGQGSLRPLLPEDVEYTVLDVSKTALSLAMAKQLKIYTRCQDITKPLPDIGHGYDLAFCFDVLEHLHVKDLTRAVANLKKLAPLVFGSICLRPSESVDDEGRNLHLSLLSVDTWEAILRDQYRTVYLQRSSDDLVFAAGD